MARQYQLTTTSKIGAIAFAVVLLGVVGFFLAFGFVLVLGLALAGALLGVGAALRRKLSGQPTADTRTVPARYGLDPTKEVRGPGEPSPGTRAIREADPPI